MLFFQLFLRNSTLPILSLLKPGRLLNYLQQTIHPFSLTLILIGSFGITHSTSAEPLNTAEPFKQCLSRLQRLAVNNGVNQQIVKQNLASVTHDEKVIEFDRRQPEFSESFANYFTKRVNQWRLDKGRQMQVKYRQLLNSLQQKYGVPPHYLMAFWGIETNFGTYKGKMSTIRSLATLACDPRRSAFFTTELMLALKLIETQHLEGNKMLGSWAGAMGHTQFMPSAYSKYAVDGDGDGKINLFDSIPDALSSAANFLHQLGWQTGFRWGREVSLEQDFDYHNSGMDKPKTLQQWHQLGVTNTNASPLSQPDISAALIVPSGHKGPAFLVYENFSVIMRWNHSEFYALAVAHLADRIAGGGKLKRPVVAGSINLSIGQLQTLQHKLNGLGFTVGKADGIMGPATKRGIRDFQYSRKMIADGFPDNSVFSALGIKLDNAGAKASLN
ncbi:MAG: membrane-bound lytic murein transglycosylase B [Alteromonadaceae bacterium]|jgi:membrane-bound lytic murein transglycosylase B